MADEKLDLDALRDEHHPCWSIGGGYDVCSSCTTVRWPCDAHRLADEIDHLTVERDRARDIAVALEQQTAEIEQIAQKVLSGGFPNAHARESAFEDALEDIVRLFGDETETKQ